MCHNAFTINSDPSGSVTGSDRFHVFPPSVDRWTVGPYVKWFAAA
jgi:hypothetical protein